MSRAILCQSDATGRGTIGITLARPADGPIAFIPSCPRFGPSPSCFTATRPLTRQQRAIGRSREFLGYSATGVREGASPFSVEHTNPDRMGRPRSACPAQERRSCASGVRLNLAEDIVQPVEKLHPIRHGYLLVEPCWRRLNTGVSDGFRRQPNDRRLKSRSKRSFRWAVANPRDTRRAGRLRAQVGKNFLAAGA